MPRLHDLELSGNCYKVRLFAALIGLKIDIVPVDFLGGAHKRAPLIDMNPLGEIPVLEDGELVLRDSQAILVYLARRYGDESWWPSDAAGQARVVEWLSSAANNVQHGPADARLVDKFGYALDKAATLRESDRILSVIDRHLATHTWLAADHVTIADVAVFPYVALAHEGGVSLQDFPQVRAWIARIKALPGFLPMPGV